MAGVKMSVMQPTMSVLYPKGAHRLLAPYTHPRLRRDFHAAPCPARGRESPNRILEVASEFLDAVLDQVDDAGLDVVLRVPMSLRVLTRMGRPQPRAWICFKLCEEFGCEPQPGTKLTSPRNVSSPSTPPLRKER